MHFSIYSAMKLKRTPALHGIDFYKIIHLKQVFFLLSLFGSFCNYPGI